MSNGQNSYTVQGDTTDARLTLDVFIEEIFPHINKYLLPKGEGVLIDVGCGNGRLNSLLYPYYETILCLDKYLVALNDRLVYPNCKFYKTDLPGLVYDGKVDCILFFTSFYMLAPYEQTFKLCNHYLKDNGMIIIADDAKRDKAELGDSNYNLQELAESFNYHIANEFVQVNGFLRTTILKKGQL
ncbi:MAG TPA: methyltransferase domain-containing protein [bacterium]|nr:methyltransferase domain-containing protein [bacterium]